MAESAAGSASLGPVDQDVPLALLAQLRSAWDTETRPATRRALFAFSVASFVGLAHLSRLGTPLARAATVGLLGLLAVVLVVRVVVVRRRRRDVRRTIKETVGATDPELAQATIRALGLAERAAVDEKVGSLKLARLHLSRLLGRASLDLIAASAGVVARRVGIAAFGFATAGLVFAAVAPMRVVEGLDVLAARNNEAPLALAYVEGADFVAKPPDYLHQHGRVLDAFEPASLPVGTTITVHARPLHAGRSLVVTDGKTEVALVDDGEGGLVARWELSDSATLRFAARFGPVLVPQADIQSLTSIPDITPKVNVEGAPRTVRMLEEPEVLVSYEASDDHGLREVDLVYRSAGREVRRVLSRPQGDPTTDRGSHRIVFGTDAFFKRTYAPIEVTVEARDNDPITGPKWGKSPAIVVVPPEVGEPEALRYEALIRARDALTDLVAQRLLDEAPLGKSSAEHLKAETEAQERALRTIEEVFDGTYGGLKFPRRAVTLTRGQLRRLTTALAEEKKTPSPATHKKLVEESEEVLLAFDAAAHSLGTSDTRRVAKRLAAVADEAAEAALGSSGQRGGDTASALVRLDAAMGVLGGGGKQMLRLGVLGLDLGEIVANDLRRIDRARKANDFVHAELAARDLAARLRKPDPSFAGGGGSGQSGESGGGKGAAGEGDPTGADDAAEQGEAALEESIKEHADEMKDVEQSLERAFSQDELDELKEEAKEHAQAIREAVKKLPRRAGDPGTAEALGKQGRDLAESMADALEQGRPRDAAQSGKEAARALDEAKRLGESAGDFDLRERSIGREAAEAKEQLAKELAWADKALEKLRKSAAERAKGDLDKAGKREGQMAERATKLAEQGSGGDGSLPEETLGYLERAEKAMRDAERALAQGDGEAGLEFQQNAQRLLEMARGEKSNEENDNQQPNSSESGEGKSLAKKAEIPGKEGHKGPDEFRKRVLQGLGGSSDPLLKEAVKRYAEGLLR